MKRSIITTIKAAIIIKELLIFISTDLSLCAKAIIDTYKKRWNIEQSYKDLREYFG